MKSLDLANAIFEVFGCVFLSFNVVRLYRDKRVAGVSVVPFAFYTAWGLFNMAYYPALGQWLSFWGGFLTTGANAVWICLYVHYTVLTRDSK